MLSKLTLSIDENIKQKAKEYAKSNGRSLSDLVEHYLKHLVDTQQNKEEEKSLSPTVKKLYGSVKPDPGVDYDALLTDELLKKYLK